jgi:hypothetical protein
MCSENVHGDSYTINSSCFKPGMYNVILMKKGEVIYTGKLIRQ